MNTSDITQSEREAARVVSRAAAKVERAVREADIYQPARIAAQTAMRALTMMEIVKDHHNQTPVDYYLHSAGEREIIGDMVSEAHRAVEALELKLVEVYQSTTGGRKLSTHERDIHGRTS